MVIKVLNFPTLLILMFLFLASPVHSNESWDVLMPRNVEDKHKFYSSSQVTIDTVDKYVKFRINGGAFRTQCKPEQDGASGVLNINGQDVKLNSECDGRWLELEVASEAGMKYVYDYIYESNTISYTIIIPGIDPKERNFNFKNSIKELEAKGYAGYGKPVDKHTNGTWLINRSNSSMVSLFENTQDKRDNFIQLQYDHVSGNIVGKINHRNAHWSNKKLSSHRQWYNPTLATCDPSNRKEIGKLTINGVLVDIPLECKSNGPTSRVNKDGKRVSVGGVDSFMIRGEIEFSLPKSEIAKVTDKQAIDISYTSQYLMGEVFNKTVSLSRTLSETLAEHEKYKRQQEKAHQNELKKNENLQNRSSQAL